MNINSKISQGVMAQDQECRPQQPAENGCMSYSPEQAIDHLIQHHIDRTEKAATKLRTFYSMLPKIMTHEQAEAVFFVVRGDHLKS